LNIGFHPEEARVVHAEFQRLVVRGPQKVRARNRAAVAVQSPGRLSMYEAWLSSQTQRQERSVPEPQEPATPTRLRMIRRPAGVGTRCEWGPSLSGAVDGQEEEEEFRIHNIAESFCSLFSA